MYFFFPVGLWLHSHQSSCLHLTAAVEHPLPWDNLKCSLCGRLIGLFLSLYSVVQFHFGLDAVLLNLHILLNIPNPFLTLFKQFQLSLRAPPVTAMMPSYVCKLLSFREIFRSLGLTEDSVFLVIFKLIYSADIVEGWRSFSCMCWVR